MTNTEKFFLAILPLPFTTLGLNVFNFSGQYIPELFFAFYAALYFVFIGKFKNIKLVLLNKKINLVLFLLLGVGSLSLLHQDFDIVNFYGRFRAIFFSILAFFVVRIITRRGQEEISHLENGLLIFTSSAAIMYIISALITVQAEASKIGISMLCFSIAICLSLEKKYFTQAAFLVILSILAAYLSFFRQNYLIAFYLLVMYVFFIILSNGSILKISKKILLPIIVIFITMSIVIYNIGYFFDFLSSSESRYIQSIGKMNDLIEMISGNGKDESSELRFLSYKYIYDNIIYFLLPNGLINDSSLFFVSIWGGEVSDLEMSISRDSVLAYFIVNFGFLISFILFFRFFISIINSFKLNYKKTLLRLILLFPPIIAVFFVDGATLTQLQKSVFFGLSVGLIIYSGKSK